MHAKVALIQSDIRWGSVEDNLQAIEQMVASTPQQDLYVLPETFATGFGTEPTEAALAEQKIVEMMDNLARRENCAVCGSLIVERNGRYRNRLLFVTPESVTHYDKRHLFSIGGEGAQYEAGQERTVVEWRGVRWLLATCYDLRFPVWLRNRGDYDAMICVASWPAARAEVWTTLLRARAIENVAYIVGVNRVGDDPTTHYAGGSAAFNYRGEAMTQPSSETCVLSAEIDIEALQTFRRKFPVDRDADKFEILIEKE
ncbi:MAG: nitrilase family protein [Rikenellaceae bacterium]|nr:nitrilase family protein [Rikenellaceae bacterium]